MIVTFTLSNGQLFEAVLVKGDQIKVEYVSSDGRKMVYMLKMSQYEKLVCN